jgi:hypothetical protein
MSDMTADQPCFGYGCPGCDGTGNIASMCHSAQGVLDLNAVSLARPSPHPDIIRLRHADSGAGLVDLSATDRVRPTASLGYHADAVALVHTA